MGYVATKRGLKTVRDMVLSMAVIGAGAAVLYLTLPNNESQDPVREIGYQQELATAGRAAPYPLVAPEGLPEKWRATSVTYRAQSDHGAVWHLGFMDPGNQYVAIEQSDGDRRKFIGKVTHRAEETDRVERVNGQEWIRYEGPKYNALVLKDGEAPGGGDGGEGSTTLVTGTASYERLKEMAAALQPYAQAAADQG
ncbi:DUF4245 domain-containing protein [Streptomyces durbertensis]|uniref:DUF4245 domain-containing protein n=1 Tax=Streptomyces durbertensis TaxID=2448886 RepID=A0ABR6EIY8_9ACTN|nr:DUF4245 domain-containing protein [Streptomyces durbertensis]